MEGSVIEFCSDTEEKQNWFPHLLQRCLYNMVMECLQPQNLAQKKSSNIIPDTVKGSNKIKKNGTGVPILQQKRRPAIHISKIRNFYAAPEARINLPQSHPQNILRASEQGGREKKTIHQALANVQYSCSSTEACL